MAVAYRQIELYVYQDRAGAGFGLAIGNLPYMIAARGGLLRAIGLAVSFIADIAAKCRRGEG